MSGGITGGAMTLQDFMRLYQPTALPVVHPQATPLAALGQAQPLDPRSMGFAQNQGQGQGQQGGTLPFLGRGSQPNTPAAPGGGGQVQSAPGGLQQLLMNAMDRNGANGNSNALANAVGYVPFGTGSFG